MLQSKDHPLDFEYGDEDEELNDLSFTSSVNTSIKQDVQIPPSNNTFTASINDTTIPHGEMTLHETSSDNESSVMKAITPTILSEKSSQPLALILHCLFKFCAFVIYIFGGFFLGSTHSGANFIIITVSCILFLAADFWVVKNITGRLLVRLRWWNMLSADGMSTRWVFESDEAPTSKAINPFDKLVFWSVLYATPFLWGALFVIGFLKFNLGWLINVVVGLVLSSSNVYGYWKCSSEQKAKFQRMVTSGAEMGAMSILRNNLMGSFFGQQQQAQQSSGIYT